MTRRFNTQSSLTYSELSGIIDALEERYKEELVATDGENLSPYKVLRGKILGLRELLYSLEDYMTSRHLDKNEDLGDFDEF